jgi:hypothetical protein
MPNHTETTLSVYGWLQRTRINIPRKTQASLYKDQSLDFCTDFSSPFLLKGFHTFSYSLSFLSTSPVWVKTWVPYHPSPTLKMSQAVLGSVVLLAEVEGNHW